MTTVAQRYDGVDWSEWQAPDPEWGALRNLNWICCRMGDGAHYDPGFAGQWATMQSQPARYKGWYLLPNPNLGVNQQLAYVREWYARSGVTFGAAGHFYSIDDEPTPSHGQFSGQAMRDLRHGLEDIFQREELHYTGLYSGNYGFIRDEGWQLWAPWPSSNGPLPDWTTNLVMWQWGVAGAGEVSGFPNSHVDVNTLVDVKAMDRLAGYTDRTGFLMALTDAQQYDLYNKVGAIFWQGGNEWPSADSGGRTVGARATQAVAALEKLAPLVNELRDLVGVIFWQCGNEMPSADSATRTVSARAGQAADLIGKLAPVVDETKDTVAQTHVTVGQTVQAIAQTGLAVAQNLKAIEKISLGGIDTKVLAQEIAARVQFDPKLLAELFADVAAGLFSERLAPPAPPIAEADIETEVQS